MAMSQMFNPYTGIMKVHPNYALTSPFLMAVNRIASKPVSMLGSQAVVVCHPTDVGSVAAVIYHIDQAGNYINRENITFQFDLSQQSTKACVLSYKSSIQSASISTTNFVLGGTINAAILPVPIADFIALIKSTPTLPSGLISFQSEDILKSSATNSMLCVGVPIQQGVQCIGLYPNEPLINTALPVRSLDNVAFTDTGSVSIDSTDLSTQLDKGTFSGTLASAVANTPSSFTTPKVPVVVGDGCNMILQVSGTVQTLPTNSTLHYNVACSCYIYSLAGNTITSIIKRTTMSLVSGDVTNVSSTFSDDFAFNLTQDITTMSDVFVNFNIVFVPTSTLASTATTLNYAILSQQSSRKRFGSGPGTLVYYVSGASAGQSLQFNCSQLVLHEPKPGVLQGYTPTIVIYDPHLFKATKMICSQPSEFGLRFVYPLSEEGKYQRDLSFALDLLSTYVRLRRDPGGDHLDALQHIFTAYPDLLTPTQVPIPHASVKSFLRKAAKWLNKRVVKPLTTPLGQAVENTSRAFGNIGANAINMASANMEQRLANSLVPRPAASDMAFMQFGPKVPNFNLNPAASSTPMSNPPNHAVLNKAYLQGLAGQTIMEAADTYYKQHRTEDLVPETSNKFSVPNDKITFFPCALEGEQMTHHIFGNLQGAQMFAIVPAEYQTRLVQPFNQVLNTTEDTTSYEGDSVALVIPVRKNGEETVCVSPPRQVSGRSFFFALEMWKRGFRGYGLAYTGDYASGAVQPIPLDTIGAKKAACKRNEFLLVANSTLADVFVSTINDFYIKFGASVNLLNKLNPRASTESATRSSPTTTSSCVSTPIFTTLTQPLHYRVIYTIRKEDILSVALIMPRYHFVKDVVLIDNMPYDGCIDGCEDEHTDFRVQFRQHTYLVRVKESKFKSEIQRSVPFEELGVCASTKPARPRPKAIAKTVSITEDDLEAVRKILDANGLSMPSVRAKTRKTVDRTTQPPTTKTTQVTKTEDLVARSTFKGATPDKPLTKQQRRTLAERKRLVDLLVEDNMPEDYSLKGLKKLLSRSSFKTSIPLLTTEELKVKDPDSEAVLYMPKTWIRFLSSCFFPIMNPAYLKKHYLDNRNAHSVFFTMLRSSIKGQINEVFREACCEFLYQVTKDAQVYYKTVKGQNLESDPYVKSEITRASSTPQRNGQVDPGNGPVSDQLTVPM